MQLYNLIQNTHDNVWAHSGLGQDPQPRCFLEGRLDIRSHFIQRLVARIVHTVIKRRSGTKRGSIWGRCLLSAGGRKRRRDVTLFWCSCCTNDYTQKKTRITGTSLFSCHVRNQNCCVRHRELRFEMRSPAGGRKNNWAKTKAAFWALPSLAPSPLSSLFTDGKSVCVFHLFSFRLGHAGLGHAVTFLPCVIFLLPSVSPSDLTHI